MGKETETSLPSTINQDYHGTDHRTKYTNNGDGVGKIIPDISVGTQQADEIETYRTLSKERKNNRTLSIIRAGRQSVIKCENSILQISRVCYFRSLTSCPERDNRFYCCYRLSFLQNGASSFHSGQTGGLSMFLSQDSYYLVRSQILLTRAKLQMLFQLRRSTDSKSKCQWLVSKGKDFKESCNVRSSDFMFKFIQQNLLINLTIFSILQQNNDDSIHSQDFFVDKVEQAN